jgi:DNA-binding MarR family transcriptional regulator
MNFEKNPSFASAPFLEQIAALEKEVDDEFQSQITEMVEMFVGRVKRHLAELLDANLIYGRQILKARECVIIATPEESRKWHPELLCAATAALKTIHTISLSHIVRANSDEERYYELTFKW